MLLTDPLWGYSAFQNAAIRLLCVVHVNEPGLWVGLLSQCIAAHKSAVPAGSPFIIINSMTTALMAYGLVGLRDDPSAIFTFMAIISLQALVSSQFLITCVWLTPTAVRFYSLITLHVRIKCAPFSAILTFVAIADLHALVSSQFPVNCVWLTPTAVRYSSDGATSEHSDVIEIPML